MTLVHHETTKLYYRLGDIRVLLLIYRICPICRALRVRRRGAWQLIQNFGQLLNLPPVGSTFD